MFLPWSDLVWPRGQGQRSRSGREDCHVSQRSLVLFFYSRAWISKYSFAGHSLSLSHFLFISVLFDLDQKLKLEKSFNVAITIQQTTIVHAFLFLSWIKCSFLFTSSFSRIVLFRRKYTCVASLKSGFFIGFALSFSPRVKNFALKHVDFFRFRRIRSPQKACSSSNWSLVRMCYVHVCSSI